MVRYVTLGSLKGTVIKTSVPNSFNLIRLISSSLREFSSLSNLREAHYEARAVQIPFCLAPVKRLHSAQLGFSTLSFLTYKWQKDCKTELSFRIKSSFQFTLSTLASAWDPMRRFGMYWTWPPLDHPTPPKGWDSSDLPGRRYTPQQCIRGT